MGHSYYLCNDCGEDMEYCECPPKWTAQYIRDHGGNLETILREHESQAARLAAAEARVKELEEAMREIEALKPTSSTIIEGSARVLHMGFGHAFARAQHIARNALVKGGEGGGDVRTS